MIDGRVFAVCDPTNLSRVGEGVPAPWNYPKNQFRIEPDGRNNDHRFQVRPSPFLTALHLVRIWAIELKRR